MFMPRQVARVEMVSLPVVRASLMMLPAMAASMPVRSINPP